MSSKLLVVGDSYCMNYIRMRNKSHGKSSWTNEPYEVFDAKEKKIKRYDWIEQEEFKLWPEIIAEEWNCNLTNLSESGAGNESIYSMALDYIVSNKVDKAIIVWSGFGRWEFEAEYLKLQKRLFRNGEVISHQLTGKILPKNNTRTAWLRYHNHGAPVKKEDERNNIEHQTSQLDSVANAGAFSLKVSVYSWFRKVYAIQQICKSLNIDLTMAQSVRPLKSYNENILASKFMITDPYLNKIDDTIFKGFPAINYIGGKCFTDVLTYEGHGNDLEKRHKYHLSSYDNHPNELGHKKIAEYILSD